MAKLWLTLVLVTCGSVAYGQEQPKAQPQPTGQQPTTGVPNPPRPAGQPLTTGMPNPPAMFPNTVYPNAANIMPNYYDRQNQPLSPYLNMLRGGNPAVNYFYGVRPGLPNAGQPLGMPQFPVVGTSQLRSGFMPSAATVSQETIELPAAGQPVTLAPSSHPVVFGNRFGTASGGYPGTMGGIGGGASKPGSGFTGNQPPPPAQRGPGR